MELVTCPFVTFFIQHFHFLFLSYEIKNIRWIFHQTLFHVIMILLFKSFKSHHNFRMDWQQNAKILKFMYQVCRHECRKMFSNVFTNEEKNNNMFMQFYWMMIFGGIYRRIMCIMCTGQNATTLHAMFSFSRSNRLQPITIIRNNISCIQIAHTARHTNDSNCLYKGEMRNETAKKK